MEFTHETLVAFSKTFGLFYLIALSIGVLIYAYRPKNKERFERAATSIFGNEDRPCR